MEYLLLDDVSLNGLQAQIKEYIDNGFEPYGNLIVNQYGNYAGQYLQGMIRK